MAKTEQSVDQVLSDAVKRGGTNIGAMEVKQMMSQMDVQQPPEEQQPEEQQPEEQQPVSPFLPGVGGYRFQPLQTTGASHDTWKDAIAGAFTGAKYDAIQSMSFAQNQTLRKIGNWLAYSTAPKPEQEVEARILQGPFSEYHGAGKSKAWKIGYSVGEAFVPSDKQELALEGLLTLMGGPIASGIKKIGVGAFKAATYKPFSIVEPTKDSLDRATRYFGSNLVEEIDSPPVVQGGSERPVVTGFDDPDVLDLDILYGQQEYGALELPQIDPLMPDGDEIVRASVSGRPAVITPSRTNLPDELGVSIGDELHIVRDVPESLKAQDVLIVEELIDGKLVRRAIPPSTPAKTLVVRTPKGRPLLGITGRRGQGSAEGVTRFELKIQGLTTKKGKVVGLALDSPKDIGTISERNVLETLDFVMDEFGADEVLVDFGLGIKSLPDHRRPFATLYSSGYRHDGSRIISKTEVMERLKDIAQPVELPSSLAPLPQGKLEKIKRMPGMESILNVISSVRGQNPVRKLKIVIDRMDEMADGFVWRSMTIIRRSYDTPFLHPDQNPLPMENGIVQRSDITQSQALPSGKWSMAANDIIEWGENFYNLPDDVRKFLRAVRPMLRNMSLYLQKEGIAFQKLHPKENDFVYLHRYVTHVMEDRVRDISKRAQNRLASLGIDIKRGPKESHSSYVRRLLLDERVRDGKIKDIDNLAKEIMSLGVSKTRRQRLDRGRAYDTAAETLDAGAMILDDIMVQISTTLKLGYQSILQQRARQALIHLTLTPDQLLKQEYPEIAQSILEAASKTRDAMQLKGVVSIARDMGGHKSNIVRFLAKRNITKKFRDAFPEMMNRIDNAILLPVRERKAALQEIFKDLDKVVGASKTQQASARKTAIATKKSLTEQPEMGSLQGVKGLQGRYVDRQIIGGREYSGEALAKVISSKFGIPTQSVAEKILLDNVVVVSQVYRTGRLAFDLSWGMIQGMGALGLDMSRLLTSPVGYGLSAAGVKQIGPWRTARYRRPSNVFLPAVIHGIWTAADPRHAVKWWTQPRRMDLAAERARHGALLQSSEFTEGYGPMRRIIEKTPVLGPLLGKFVGLTYGRADLAWGFMRNASAQLQYEHMRPLARTAKDLEEMAKVGNIITGVFSTKGIGVNGTQEKLLQGAAFLAPRFTFSQFALVRAAFRGGYTGSEVRQMILGLAAFNSMFFGFVPIMLGQKPTINPLPKSMGGDGTDLWTIDIGEGRRIGWGSTGYTMIKFLANIASVANDDPKALVTPDWNNPYVRFWRGKAPGPIGMVIAYGQGKDFGGDPIRGDKWYKPTRETAEWLALQFTTVWQETLIKDGMALAVADFYGMRARPESEWGTVKRLTVEADPKGRRWDELSNHDKNMIERANPQVREAKLLFQERARLFGWDKDESAFWTQRYDIDTAYDTEIAAATEAFYNEAGFTMRDIAEVLKSAGIRRGGLYQAMETNPRYDKVREKMTGTEYTHPEDVAYKEYMDIMADPENYDPIKRHPNLRRQEQLEIWEEEWKRENFDAWEKASERAASGRIGSPFFTQLKNYSNTILKEYYQIPEVHKRTSKGKLYAQALVRVAEERKAPRYNYEKIKNLEDADAIREGDAAITELRTKWLMEHPEGEAWLYFWGEKDDWIYRKEEGRIGRAERIYMNDLAELTEQKEAIRSGDNPEKVIELFKGE